MLSHVRNKGTAQICPLLLPWASFLPLSWATKPHLWPQCGPGGIILFSLSITSGLAWDPRADCFILTCNGGQGHADSPAQDASLLSLGLPFAQVSFAPPVPPPISVAGAPSLAGAQPPLHLVLVLEGDGPEFPLLGPAPCKCFLHCVGSGTWSSSLGYAWCLPLSMASKFLLLGSLSGCIREQVGYDPGGDPPYFLILAGSKSRPRKVLLPR